jgi:hypothetical protein
MKFLDYLRKYNLPKIDFASANKLDSTEPLLAEFVLYNPLAMPIAHAV